ncbi:MAG: hypothetical protein BWX71_00878 [Deltaproteobacteria bacterium ADurb.Bin072]|nr:MAG: hypothetical protein BWX71_00878 [Deltaproteobacteria bacterium ADurb.Bin072]
MKMAEGSFTSWSPVCFISKTPISPDVPKRFLDVLTIRYAPVSSPSNDSTVSTICSSILGPATSPSLVTCPTMNTVTPLALAISMRTPAQWRICDTLPGGAPTDSEYTDWMESMMARSYTPPSTSSRMLSMRTSGNTTMPLAARPSL